MPAQGQICPTCASTAVEKTATHPPYELQVLLPIHNEADSIEATVNELYAGLSSIAKIEFIFCEDGSRDNTKNILRQIATGIPAKLLICDERKGYSRAVRDGMLEMTAPYLLCLDSDGQCDPKDFQAFWKSRGQSDVVIGWRTQRADSLMRKLMSRAFYRLWRILYRCPIHDPSCPYMLARREVIQSVAPAMGAMQEGFWWEFMARVHRSNYTILELPVHHRDRASGKTQVYRLKKLPGIGCRHLIALFRILSQTRPSK